MTDELKPCPFCGNEARVRAQHWDDGSHVWWVECAACEAEGMRCDDGQHAIDAWNTRAERTCTMAHEGERLWLCSRCGSYYERADAYPYKYCPRCGAKVVRASTD